jgi:hypothetical protein
MKLYCSLRNSAREWNRPTARSRENYCARLAGNRPEAEKRPAAHSRETLRAPGRENGPKPKNGPPARSRSARPALQAATWVWAGKDSPHLG